MHGLVALFCDAAWWSEGFDHCDVLDEVHAEWGVAEFVYLEDLLLRSNELCGDLGVGRLDWLRSVRDRGSICHRDEDVEVFDLVKLDHLSIVDVDITKVILVRGHGAAL